MIMENEKEFMSSGVKMTILIICVFAFIVSIVAYNAFK